MLKRLFIVAIAMVTLTAMVCGGTEAAITQKKPFDARSYAHAQRLVSIGGRRMNIFCSGTGAPTVILDAGLGEETSKWRYVQGPIARHTRVCSYDRAGMGYSDPTTSTRDASAVVSDLHALLRAAGIAPPYVLVGHSIAGLYDRLYADRYPHDVVGLVFVDPSTEYDDKLIHMFVPTSKYSSEEREQDGTYRACIADVSTCALGNLTLLKKSLTSEGCPKVDPSECAVNEEVHVHEFVRPMFFTDVYLELLALPKMSPAEVHAEQRRFRDLPLIVLSAGHPEPDSTLTASQRYAMWIAEVHLQERVAALSSRGANFVIDGSGHLVQIDRPSAVISAVDEVVDQARYSAHSVIRRNTR